MQSLVDEIRIEIFKFVQSPLSLSLTERKWNVISRDPHARAEWLIYKYGRGHALFHAVRLGKGFITEDVVQALLTRKVNLSRYFIQRLLMHFGSYDERLNELKIEYNVNQLDFDRIRAFQQKLKSPWASDLAMPVFTTLLTEGYKALDDRNLAAKGDDMSLFHFLSAGPVLNLKEIEGLILNKRLIPFPPRPKPIFEDTTEYNELIQERAREDYPPKDGYENNRQLNVVARAILIHPDLVNLWKTIGYYEICHDVNDLVMQGALLILFPPTPPNDWETPGVDIVVDRLRQLISIGFQLGDVVMEEAFHLFEHKLDEIGDILIESFQTIHNKSKSDIACASLIQAIRPERNHRKTDLLKFLIERIEQPTKALINALGHYKVGFKYDANSIKDIKFRSLSVHSNFYYWALKTYGPNSEITQMCFEDILESRIWIDLKLQEDTNLSVPENLTTAAFNSICSIYLEFCNEKVRFKPAYLQYLKLASNEEIIKPFFGISLPILFDLPVKYALPFEITYEYDRPAIILVQSNKRKFNEMMNDMNEMKEWSTLLKKMRYGNSDTSENFKNNLKEFWERITSSQSQPLIDEFNMAGPSTKSVSKRPRQ